MAIFGVVSNVGSFAIIYLKTGINPSDNGKIISMFFTHHICYTYSCILLCNVTLAWSIAAKNLFLTWVVFFCRLHFAKCSSGFLQGRNWVGIGARFGTHFRSFLAVWTRHAPWPEEYRRWISRCYEGLCSLQSPPHKYVRERYNHHEISPLSCLQFSPVGAHGVSLMYHWVSVSGCVFYSREISHAYQVLRSGLSLLHLVRIYLAAKSIWSGCVIQESRLLPRYPEMTEFKSTNFIRVKKFLSCTHQDESWGVGMILGEHKNKVTEANNGKTNQVPKIKTLMWLLLAHCCWNNIKKSTLPM